MFRSIAVLLVLAAHVYAAQSPDNSPRVVRIGVLDLTGENISDAEIRLLSDRLRIELYRTGRFEVLERERMTDILAEHEFSLSGCVANECLVDLGQMLSVERMVAGSVGRIGDVHTLNLRMIAVETGAINGIAVKDCQCPLSQVLTRVLGRAAADLARGMPGAAGASQLGAASLGPQETQGEQSERGDVNYTKFGKTSVGGVVGWLVLLGLVVALLSAA